MIKRKPKKKNYDYCKNGMKADVQKLKTDMVIVKNDVSWLKKLTTFTAGGVATTGAGIVGKIVYDLFTK